MISATVAGIIPSRYSKIVTNGLIFWIDAMNDNSYPGTGTIWSSLRSPSTPISGTFVNSPTYAVDNGGTIQFTEVNSSSIDFNSDSSKFSSLLSGTVNVWFRCKSTQTGGTTFSISELSDPKVISINRSRRYPTPTYAVIVDDDDGGSSDRNITAVSGSAGELLDGMWHMATWVCETAANSFYLDGVQQTLTYTAGSTATGNFLFPAAINRFNIGVSSEPTGPVTTQWFDGDIAIIHMYNRPLTATEIVQNFNADYPRFRLQASGGLETTIKEGNINWKVHTFNSSSNFTVYNTGSIEYLIVGGGGKGGDSLGAAGDRTSAGGGGGGVISGSITITSGTYSIVVGSGGLAANPNGQSSSFHNIGTSGGGRGGYSPGGATYYSGNSGSSGGGAMHNPVSLAGSGTLGQGFKGGVGYDSGDVNLQFGAGGGGGAGSTGSNAESSTSGRAGGGGTGSISSITGVPTYYGGGGGGGAQYGASATSYQAGYGGPGGGGAGARHLGTTAGTTSGSDGQANTGGGGGGSAAFSTTAPTAGGNGGSGVVIIRYRI